MRFKGWKPYQEVIMNRIPLYLGKTDENGELEITNEEAIERALKAGYQVVEPPKEPESIQEPEPVIFKCKICGLTVENKGALLAHYREIHPKEK
jgi:hypothetical protein